MTQQEFLQAIREMTPEERLIVNALLGSVQRCEQCKKACLKADMRDIRKDSPASSEAWSVARYTTVCEECYQAHTHVSR